ncbi:TRAP transporter permease [Quisquiliibacterium transsilvanicum]|uniref:TRAP transporter 4TM/12TM fusion protein n=1 Tax=Quisquiliibacterium transsilvanicum TaxID=1549638 RepID=A0A7W8M827_9BURK|nr:TRAP transporter fused permease subunit [Quisquiliibacterium transsilvanicum]MBB5271197.1 TRAP transporter 4TM/12TM fusion protein [Quisquiliibacterium transsilvanicum]
MATPAQAPAELPVVEDPEARSVRLEGPAFWAAFVLTSAGLLISINQLFNLGLGGFRPVSTGYYYLMIGLFVAVGFLAFPARKGQLQVRWYDWVLAALVLGASLWLASRAQFIIDRGWNQDAPIEATVVAGLYVLLALEAVRRTGETILLVFCLIFACYPLYAGYMPGFLWGVQLDFGQTVREHVYGLESIIGIPMQVVSDTLIGFIVFGVVLANTGGSGFFMDFASSMMGRARGGPAKVAIVSSGLFGMLSGSPTSNVLTTGTMTIPTMKRSGYDATYAGAIEACASTGGCLMPPVMGAAAFIMASFLNVPYAEVVTAAFLPAILFYLALMVQADLYAARNGLRGLDASEVPRLLPTIGGGWYYLLALAGLTALLLVWRVEGEAPFWVSLFLLAVAVLRGRKTGFGARAFARLVVDVGQAVAQLVCLIAGIGLIVGAMSVTGVANSFSRELVQYAGGNLALLLAAGALTSFVLGMGMTASACYIFLAIVLAPALIQVGIDPMAAHLYIFYWGIVSFITPPVALAAIAAASIAKADAMAVGFKALRVGSVLLLLPVLFVLQPALILKGAPLLVIQAAFTATLAVILLAASFEGYLWRLGRLSTWARVAFCVAGLLLFIPEGYTDLAGAVLAALTAAMVAATRRVGGSAA